MIPVKFFDAESNLTAYTPYENVRIKVKSQNSEKFVHGGASLQELVIPVIKFNYVRPDSNEYQNKKAAYDTKPVEIGLLNPSNHVAKNKNFTVQFYQKQPVGGLNVKAEYKVYFRDATGKIISDEHTIVADLLGENEQQRKFPEFRVTLRDGNEYLVTDNYYLVIKNTTTGSIEEIQFTIDIPLSVGGFDFFS